MTTIDGPLALGSGDALQQRPGGIFARPTAKPGWRGWITSVDHKKVAILYGAAAIFFFLIGGIEAMMIRIQLAAPEG
jgi:cytochrome c oxidase subunit 1